MPIIVQKFGGTSVADTEKILAAARKAVRAQQQGYQVIVVVSAMGKNTDMLEQLALEVNERPPAREMDMLLSTGEQVSVALMAMAVDALGYKAISLTGAQIGIQTDSSHTKARIHNISTDRIRRLLDEGNIVIAAGFQGIDENFDITTLGRGGSDTTAVALSAVLQAEACEIYTDVDGVYTTDPRLLPEARLISAVCYDEMLELASLGAGVMHSRSIEFGKKFHVPIRVRSSFSDAPGSLIVERAPTAELPVSGAALTRDEARITIRNLPDSTTTLFDLFRVLDESKIAVDMIVQNVSEQGRVDFTFTVPRSECGATVAAVAPIVESAGGQMGAIDPDVSKVSVVGMGMARQSGVAHRMFRALASADINMQMITTSEIKISALVQREQAIAALRTVHNEFELDKGATDAPFEFHPESGKTVDALAVIDRLHGVGMESLTIDDVTLDDTQSRFTLRGVPDRPGVAAEIFERVAAAGIFVDMIVQSYAVDQTADISFTTPVSQFEACSEIVDQIASGFPGMTPACSRNIAKLTVSGVGLRSHTGVAIEMFAALSEAGIGVEMVSTSEVRVNVVVDGESGQRGLEALKQRLAYAMN